jgi:hypothetical protein
MLLFTDAFDYLEEKEKGFISAKKGLESISEGKVQKLRDISKQSL